ncbi:hypothetical protein BAE44_0004251 [Dichanthelium oligosanthes]|uniref:Uncharacterized protein n=1 Tax=Dichanthelium oligosanthes TaxID=888268 RepID=A0A1E5WBC7_9POAL|nr:hypothetical protein BAE44_0004251 [Dichanthelium oligosanthes]
MSKRGSNEKQRHLYLVLDDWSQGYSIRKINLSAEYIRLPLIPADVARGDAIFTCRVLVFDIHKQTLILGHGSWPRQDVLHPIYISIGGRLFVLGGGSFDMVYPLPAYDDANWENFAWSSFKLPNPTFQCDRITSYVVHPDEQTMFVSSAEEAGVPATFTFKPMMWRRHGPWQLPFTGRGYFVPKLGAWVGLSRDLNTIGHICSCNVVSASSVASHNECPALKLSKEKLFSDVPAEKHIGATLVYMGGENKFCLLEGICTEADQATDSDETNEDSVGEVNETDFDKTNED